MVDAAAASRRPRLPLLIAADVGMLLVRRAAEIRAAKHRLAKRVQLLALVDAVVRRILLLLLPLMVIGHCQLNAGRAADDNIVDVLRRVRLLQATVLDTVLEVHDET